MGERNELGVDRVIVYIWVSEHLERSGDGKAGHVAVEITRENKPGNRNNFTYISFWPNWPLNENEWPLHKARPNILTDNKRWSLMGAYTDDRLLEERKPEYIFCFYTLSTSDIINSFRNFYEREGKKWQTFGNYFPATRSKNVTSAQSENNNEQSCVSLACMVLDAGKMNMLLSHADVLKASGKQQLTASHQNCAEMSRDRNLQPLYNTSDTSGKGLAALCGYVISPDILVGRLKEAKVKEWNSNPKVRKMKRMVFTTKISGDGLKRSTSFSYQDPNKRLPDRRSSPSCIKLQLTDPDVNGNILNEETFEWLPLDDDFDRKYSFLFVCLIISCIFVPLSIFLFHFFY